MTEERARLRARLRDAREQFAAAPAFAAAAAALASRLVEVLHRLEPQSLGLYWPIRSEFDAAAACADDARLRALPWSLPFSRRAGRQMEFRRWDGSPPPQLDECGLPASVGAVVVPDVVLVPCVGYSVDGYRLGYGGGYFDRWLAAHPQVTAVGVAWSVGLMAACEFEPQPHDRPLTVIVTELEVVG